jgi:hypothetical protein
VRRKLVLDTVTRDERHPATGDRPDRRRRRRRAVRRFDGDLLDVLQEGIEAGPTEHADLDGLGHADFSVDDPDEDFLSDPDPDPEEDEDEESDDELDPGDESPDFDPESPDFDPESFLESPPPLVALERRESVA